MFQRKRTGSVLCPSCGKLVGVNDEECYNCGRRNPGMWGLTALLGQAGRTVPFDQVIIGGTVFLYLAMLAVDPEGIGKRGGLFNLLAPSQESILRFGASGAWPVWRLGHWWTLLSAGWLHGSLLHIGFNIYWVRYLAPATAELFGAARMTILYTFSSAFAFLLSSSMGLLFPGVPFLGGAQVTVGASAPILGLLGALVWYGRATGSRTVGGQAWSYALVMILFGFLVGGRVDNWAHLGGFAGGYMAAVFLDPRKPERPAHTALAIACLVATVGAIVASLVTPLPI